MEEISVSNHINYLKNELKHDIDQKYRRKNNLTEHELNWKDFFLFILMYLVLQQVLVLVFAVFSIIFDRSFGTDTYSYIFEIQYISLIDLLAFVLTLFRFRSVNAFLKDRYNLKALSEKKTYLYIVLAFAANYFLQYFILDVMMFEQAGSQIDLFGLDRINPGFINSILLVLAFVVIAPIVEEVLFRGLIFGFLDKKVGFNWALYISSISFGLLHPGHRLSTTISGMIFVYLYKKTESLWALIVLHAAWNAVAIFMLMSSVLAS